MTSNLVETITERATKSFSKPVTKENYDTWFAHWIATGEKFYSELEAEGLKQSCAAVREAIEFQKRYMTPERKESVKPIREKPVYVESDPEPILEDNYPIYADYLYVADGKVYRSDYHQITVRELKQREGFKEVRRASLKRFK